MCDGLLSRQRQSFQNTVCTLSRVKDNNERDMIYNNVGKKISFSRIADLRVPSGAGQGGGPTEFFVHLSGEGLTSGSSSNADLTVGAGVSITQLKTVPLNSKGLVPHRRSGHAPSDPHLGPTYLASSCIWCLHGG